MGEKVIKRVAYSPVVADLFHYGHLQSLQFAYAAADYHICGILSDEAVQSFRRKPIANLQERKAVVSNLTCVDEVMIQTAFDPSDNLKKIRERFPQAELIVIRGSNWKKVPELPYLKQIGGRILQHPYYEELSDFKVVNKIFEHYGKMFRDFETLSKFFKINDLTSLKETNGTTALSTKAETLQSLQAVLQHGKIEKSFIFTVAEWATKEEEIMGRIQKLFPEELVVVRSSAVQEDSLKSSLAGFFHSELNVATKNGASIREAVNKVIRTYAEKKSYDAKNQVLIQRQTRDVQCSGVVFTRQLETNNPYYVINYDDLSGLTNTVTKGMENRVVYISRFCEEKDVPSPLRGVITAVREVESLLPTMGLDIEFSVNKQDEVIIFQVRPLSVNVKVDIPPNIEIKEKLEELKRQFDAFSQKKEHLSGTKTIFADMPDWNPAEIIGDNPHYLDYSLYDYLITDSAWHQARTSQGYYNVSPAKLVFLFGNKPYVDVRHSFNSFLPASLPEGLREKLINFYIDKLQKNLHLQDKVEFEVLYTCYDLTFYPRSKELLAAGFTAEEVCCLKKSLLQLTNSLVSDSSIRDDLAFIQEKKKGGNAPPTRTPQACLRRAIQLLDNCRSSGTVQFSRLARLAFVGKILIKSLVAEGILEEGYYHQFMNSIITVVSKMNEDFYSLSRGGMAKKKILEKYGHLRPGTYDITALRYDQNENLFGGQVQLQEPTKIAFSLPQHIQENISATLQEQELAFDSNTLFTFTRAALEARELSKFEFTRELSDALELIAQAGRVWGLSRESLSHLDVDNLKVIADIEDDKKAESILTNIIEHRSKERRINDSLLLPPVIMSKKDIEVVSSYRAKPNFTTSKSVEGEIIALSGLNKEELSDFTGKIILLENGDPGHDWIFTKNPAGLITKYGGVASHMVIRCAELGVPAAIGCGDLFDEIKKARKVLLNCKEQKIIPC